MVAVTKRYRHPVSRRDVVPASSDEVLATLRRNTTAGPFFTVPTSTEAPGDGGWLPAGALVEPGDGLAAAVEAVRRWASDTRPRVAASLFLMSYAARLLSAAVAGVVLGDVLVDLRRHEWRYVPGTGLQLRLPVLAGWKPAPDAEPDVLLPVLGDVLVDDHLAATIRAVRSVVPVAERLLWGNVASSLAGALQSLAAAGVPPARCRAVGDSLLALPRLRGTGAFTGPALAFRRRSCCLFYLLPASGKCADCALLP